MGRRVLVTRKYNESKLKYDNFSRAMNAYGNRQVDVEIVKLRLVPLEFIYLLAPSL